MDWRSHAWLGALRCEHAACRTGTTFHRASVESCRRFAQRRLLTDFLFTTCLQVNAGLLVGCHNRNLSCGIVTVDYPAYVLTGLIHLELYGHTYKYALTIPMVQATNRIRQTRG